MLELDRTLELFRAATADSLQGCLKTLPDVNNEQALCAVLEQSATALRSVFDATLSQELQAINERAAARHIRLPDEMWSLAWQKLTFKDRVSVTHVCKRWRSRSLASPRVWSYIVLRSSLHSRDEHDDSWGPPTTIRVGSFTNPIVLNTALSRSKSAPLDLRIHFTSMTLYEPEYGDVGVTLDYAPLSQYCTALLPHTSRIRSLVFIHESRNSEAVGFFFNHVGQLPMLQYFNCQFRDTIVGDDDDLEDLPEVPYLHAHVLSKAPALKAIEISPPVVKFKFHGAGRNTVSTVLRSLTSVSLALVTYVEIFRLFNGCPNISDARLSLLDFRQNSSAAPSALVLPNLRHLRLVDLEHGIEWNPKSSLRDLFEAGPKAHTFHLQFHSYPKYAAVSSDVPVAALRELRLGDTLAGTWLAVDITIGPSPQQLTISVQDISPGAILLVLDATMVPRSRRVSLWCGNVADCFIPTNLWANLDPEVVTRLRLTFLDASAECVPCIGSIFSNLHELDVRIPHTLNGPHSAKLTKLLGFTDWRSAFPHAKHVRLLRPEDDGVERRLAGGIDELAVLLETWSTM